MKKTLSTKEIIIIKAGMVFAQKGYYTASISDIIEEAGIARGTFYQYFKSKKQIFQYLIEDMLNNLEECIEPIKLGSNLPPPIEQLKSNIKRVIELFLERRDLAKIIIGYRENTDSEIDIKIENFFENVHELIETSIQVGITIGILREVNPYWISIAILGMFKELLKSVLEKNDNALDINEIIDQIVQFGLKGVIAINPQLF